MNNHTTPEKVGIKTENIIKYLESLEKKNLATHNVIMARGNEIFFEAYWKPFNSDMLHRMYSVSKSFVSIAIGFLEQDGIINLDDKIEKYFPEECKNTKNIYMHNQTVRDMLMMRTSRVDKGWFSEPTQDRVYDYFNNKADIETNTIHPSGTVYNYDSWGSFILGSMVERLTKKPLMDYLYDKFMYKIGVREGAHCLKCPGGHSWSDSAVLIRPADLLKVARFILNKGSWNGEQILNKEYIEKATSCLSFNNFTDIYNYNTCGYGYQFWRTYENSFYFNGMGCQYAVCVPDKDIILIYNGDNQGKEAVRDVVIDDFFSLIVDTAQDHSLKENVDAKAMLSDVVSGLELICARGKKHSEIEKDINNITYKLQKNEMGISEFSLSFYDDFGIFRYINAQGEKEIKFGLCKNEFSFFPQEGYSDEVGGQSSKNHFYKCASSAAWVGDDTLSMKIQIIDKYFGNMTATVSFKDNFCTLYMEKYAENFLNEYNGFAGGMKKI